MTMNKCQIRPSISVKSVIYLSLPLGIRRALVVWAVLLWALAITATAAASRLVISPERIDLQGGEKQHGLLVTLVESDGHSTDVTLKSTLTSSTPQIATIDQSGQVVALADGQAEIAVSFGGKTAKASVTTRDTAKARTPSFRQDVEPILTKSGCNQGGCHGKLAGQNGFKLSLRAFAPDWDHDWLTKDISARRVNFAFPAESLLLQKASGGVQHEGGTRFREDSRSYRMLADWIAARAPAPVADEAEPVRLEVIPGDRSMHPGETQQLLVRANYADGRVRDVTWLAQFFSNDEGMLKVKPDGLVKSLRAGEGSVRVHFQGLVEVAHFTMPYDQSVKGADFSKAGNVLDKPIFAKLKSLHLAPSPDCDDSTYLRRAFIDTIGILPTPEEVEAFLADKRRDKRARLADSLLARPEWVDYWALQISDLLQNRKERDHDVRGVKGVRAFHGWVRDQLSAGRGWDQIASSVLLAKGDVVANPQIGYFITLIGEKSNVEESELPDSVAQAFLGARVGCARCHNHPLERYTQDDFYHFSAFFSKVAIQRENPEKAPSALHFASHEQREQERRATEIGQRVEEAEVVARAFGEEPGGEEPAKRLGDQRRELAEVLKRIDQEKTKQPSVNQPRTGKPMAPQGLDRAPWKYEAGCDPREQFVESMLKSDQFSGAMVNRLWKHFFSVGLVEPVDDLRASNPPSNSELWALLNKEFAANHFDLRHLMKLILTSRAYQLSSATHQGNQTDTRFYSHYYARRLPAEVLMDAIAAGTGTPTKFEGHPLGVRAVQVPEPNMNSYFLTLFGRSDRVTACACERSGEVTLPQLLHLHNGEDLQKQIADPAGRLAALLKNPDDRAVFTPLFQATVGRRPTELEIAAVTKSYTPAEREQGLRDLLWSLLNSKEFAFNH